MDHHDHVALLRDGVLPVRESSVWADLGAGEGAFTLALADLLGAGGRIIAVDRDGAALATLTRSVTERFPGVRLETHLADFAQPLELPSLDGLVMANSLHFVPPAEQPAIVARLSTHLRPGGRFVVVEYDADRGSQWVPFPFRFSRFEAMARDAGLVAWRAVGRVPSRYLGAIWSGVAERSVRS